MQAANGPASDSRRGIMLSDLEAVQRGLLHRITFDSPSNPPHLEAAWIERRPRLASNEDGGRNTGGRAQRRAG
jgi:hypothetical protein